MVFQNIPIQLVWKSICSNFTSEPLLEESCDTEGKWSWMKLLAISVLCYSLISMVSADVWHIEDVDGSYNDISSTSIALRSNGAPRIAYIDTEGWRFRGYKNVSSHQVVKSGYSSLLKYPASKQIASHFNILHSIVATPMGKTSNPFWEWLLSLRRIYTMNWIQRSWSI